MKKVFMLFLFIIVIVFSTPAFAQDTASVTWKLTKHDTTEVSSTLGPIVGYKESFANLYVTIYNGPVGPIDSSQKVCMTTWPYATSYDTSSYIQFAVSPAIGADLKIINVTIPCGAHGGSNQTIDIFYSTDSFATSVKLNSASIGLGKDLFTVPAPSFNINVPVTNGKTFAVRVYPWLKSSSGSQTGKYVCLQNVVISGTTVTGVKDNYLAPAQFNLLQNYPNPFNPSTVIDFTIPVSGMINLSVYNLLGEKVSTILNERMEPGVYERNFNGNNMPTGIYIYRLTMDNYTLSKKMILMK